MSDIIEQEQILRRGLEVEIGVELGVGVGVGVGPLNPSYLSQPSRQLAVSGGGDAGDPAVVAVAAAVAAAAAVEVTPSSTNNSVPSGVPVVVPTLDDAAELVLATQIALRERLEARHRTLVLAQYYLSTSLVLARY